MGKALAAIAVAILCVSATGEEVEGRWSSSMPPFKYHGDTLVPVLFVQPEQIEEACGVKPPEQYRVIACTRTLKRGGRIVIMPNPCRIMDDPYAKVLCHENAHYLGWPGDHPYS